MEFFLQLLFGGLLLIIFAYAIVRSVSFAYFRTKYEYLRRSMKEIRKGDNDGTV